MPDTLQRRKPTARMAKTLAREAHPGFGARLLRDLRLGWRHWGYSLSLGDWGLRGRLPLKVTAIITDARSGNTVNAEEILAGKLTGYGRPIAINENIWKRAATLDDDTRRRVERFDFLIDLAASAKQEDARKTAEYLTGYWCEDRARWDMVSWDPVEIAHRLCNWLSHIPLILGSKDMIYRSRVLVTMARQTRHLARSASDAPRGIDALRIGCTLMMAGYLLPTMDRMRDRGRAVAGRAILDTVLPDGGPRSRAFQDSVDATAMLLMVRRAAKAVDEVFPSELQSALDRLGPFFRALQHGDASFAGFHGLAPAGQFRLHSWLKEADAAGRAIDNAAFTGMQRITEGDSVLIADAGPPPPYDMAGGAHASTGAFEFSHSLDRIIVNMGTGAGGQGIPADLAGLTRGSSAHSLMVIDDRNITGIDDKGRLDKGATETSFERETDHESSRLMIRHNGYGKRFGVRQSRQFTLMAGGDTLLGEETLTPLRGKLWDGAPLSLRFHLHPKVQARETAGGILLSLPSGTRWKLTLDDGDLHLEDSVYLRRPSEMEPSQSAVFIAEKPARTALRLRWTLEKLPAIAPRTSGALRKKMLADTEKVDISAP